MSNNARDSAVPVLTIDGPSGAGKGTVSRKVADALRWNLLDSGALYRLVGLAAFRRGVPLDSPADLARLVNDIDIAFSSTANGGERVTLDGVDVGADIRTEDCGELASRVAAVPAVRAALVDKQHGFRQPPGLVADGRDMGTVIFPDAPLKIFLTASARERARRRHKQLKQKGIDGTFCDLYDDIRRRDRRDEERGVAPLAPAPDAMLLDTTSMSIDEVVATVTRLAQKLV
jgi:cytidylate kinase